MSDNKNLYATILGIQAPWLVTEVDVSPKQERVTVTICSRPEVRTRARPAGSLALATTAVAALGATSIPASSRRS